MKPLKNLNTKKYLNAIPDLRKNKRTTEITYLILTLIALIFFGLAAINPTLSTIAKLRKELEDSKFVDSQLQTKISNLATLQEEYQAISSDLPLIDEAVPKMPLAPLLAAQIQSVAQSSSVTILTLQMLPVELTKKTTGKEKYGTSPFSILIEGQYSDLYNFLDSLSRMQRIVSIEQISMLKKSEDSTTLQLNIRGSGYFKQ